jgi:hypothetical protein
LAVSGAVFLPADQPDPDHRSRVNFNAPRLP